MSQATIDYIHPTVPNYNPDKILKVKATNSKVKGKKSR